MRPSRRKLTLQDGTPANIYDDNDANEPGDDFDDFEEGAQAGADDDFGDFDQGFQGPEAEAETVDSPPVSTSQINSIPTETFVSFLCSAHFRCRCLC